MEKSISHTEQVAILGVVKELEDAWNAGQADAFGAPMAENADFVTIRADHLRGRQAIIDSHTGVFTNFYAGSTKRFSMESVRMLREDVALAHVRAVLDSPSGPLKGQHEAAFSLVLLRENEKWEITAFQITLATPTPDH